MAVVVGDRPLQDTPTWAIAGVCAVFVIISVLIEHGIHKLGKWFQKRQKKAMGEALEKIKNELMLLGFISLLLTVGTTFISKICIPENFAHTMLPCEYVPYVHDQYDNGGGGGGKTDDHSGDGRRRLLVSFAEDMVHRRVLAGGAGDDYCFRKGQISLISQTGLHQLHIFIFVLAVFHVLYSIITMALGQAKLKKWKSWELETTSLEYEFTNDPARFRFAHQTSFVKRHSGLSTKPGIRWVVAFFRQFFGSVSKVDYLTMRRGFINAHFSPTSKFDFHRYVKRCMEDDFKVVVGISIPLWIFAVVFLLFTVYRWHTLSWLTAVPAIILLMVGTKMELVIMEMAQQIQNKSTIVNGAPVVEPSDAYFWFNRPEWILLLIHYTLFQNAFQMAFFLWTMYEFGVNSCFNENFAMVLSTVILDVALQFVCSYITFPLYSLVTQMGTHMKHAIFEEQMAKALKKWQQVAKDRKKLREASAASPNIKSSGTTPTTSPKHLLSNFKVHSTKPDIESVPETPTYLSDKSDPELSHLEDSTRHTNIRIQGGEDQEHEQNIDSPDHPHHNMEFTFVSLR